MGKLSWFDHFEASDKAVSAQIAETPETQAHRFFCSIAKTIRECDL